MIVTKNLLRSLVVALAASVLSLPTNAVVVPTITAVNVRPSNPSDTFVTVDYTYTAIDLNDEGLLAQLDGPWTHFSGRGLRFRGADGGDYVRFAGAPPFDRGVSGREARVAFMNYAMFGDPNPAPGTTLATSGSVSISDYQRTNQVCVGLFLLPGITPYPLPAGSALAWPYGCVTTPPPNQSCSLNISDTNPINLGVVAPGPQSVTARLRANCNLAGNITIANGVSSSSGTGVSGTLSKVSVVHGSKTSLMPVQLAVPSGRGLDFSIKMDFTFTGAGQSTNNVVITWFPS